MVWFFRHEVSGGAAMHEREQKVVSLSAGLAPLRQPLADILGEAYVVTVDHPDDADVAVVGSVGVPGIRFLRLRHPRPLLVVVGSRVVDPDSDRRDYLAAGADGYLAHATPTAVAQQIHAIAKRTTGVQSAGPAASVTVA
jgi:DNA-binding NarL/FixJ family response regulator